MSCSTHLLCFVREKPADLWHVLNSFYPDKPTVAFGYCEEERHERPAIAIGFRDMGDTEPGGEAGTVCTACLRAIGRAPADVHAPGETREEIEARYSRLRVEGLTGAIERLENELADCHAVSEAYRIDVGRLQAAYAQRAGFVLELREALGAKPIFDPAAMLEEVRQLVIDSRERTALGADAAGWRKRALHAEDGLEAMRIALKNADEHVARGKGDK